MSRTIAPRHLLSSALVLAAIGVAGCSDSTGPGRPLTPDQAEELGFTIATEVETSVNALVANGLLGSVEGSLGAQRPQLNAPTLAAVEQPECATPSQNPILDNDADNIPNDVTFAFTAANCTFQFPNGSMAITGSIRLIDSDADVAGFSYSGTVSNLRVAFTGEEGSFSVTQNGSVGVSLNATQLTLTQNFVSAISATGFPGASITNTLSATFTPSGGGTLVVGQPLPDGTFVPASSITVSQAGQGGVFTLSAPTPLQYSAECAAAGAVSVFTAGELRATIETTDGNGYVRLVYSGCEEPSVLFVATN